MIFSSAQKRIILLLLAVVCIGLAVGLPSLPTGEDSTHRVTALYQSELLDDEVSIPTLSAFTFTEEFQDLVGASVQVEAVRESPFYIQVTTELPTETRLLTAHKRAIHLLSAEVKEQAMGEVRADLNYLEEVKRKAAKLGQSREEDEARLALTKTDRSTQALSATDTQRLVFLKDEIKSIETFLDGSPLPKTVRARLDRESLNAAEKRVRNQQAELSRLAKLFHPSSKTVQAQRGSLEAAQSDLAEIELRLAEVYLRALRLELETLDDKASTRIQSTLTNSERESAASPRIGTGVSTGSAWLDDRQKELEARGEAITNAASLKQEGKLTFSLVQSGSQLWSVGCWLSALLFFLLAMFSEPGADTEESPSSPISNEPTSPRKTSSTVRIELPLARASLSPDQSESFFESVCSEINEALGREPRRLLVISDSDTDARLAFSIRLANSLGRKAKRVRLIDFDFQHKSLSERLGRRESPGVSELIAHGGPVEEFFSSISGTRIQFAPAGNIPAVTTEAQFDRLSQILETNLDEVTVIDSSTNSFLELLQHQLDAVLWILATEEAAQEYVGDTKTVSKLRSAGLPVWGVSVTSLKFFPIV